LETRHWLPIYRRMILQYLCATLLRLASGEGPGGEVARGKNEGRRVAARSTAANALEPRAQSGKMPDQQTRSAAAGLWPCVQFREDRMIRLFAWALARHSRSCWRRRRLLRGNRTSRW